MVWDEFVVATVAAGGTTGHGHETGCWQQIKYGSENSRMILTLIQMRGEMGKVTSSQPATDCRA